MKVSLYLAQEYSNVDLKSIPYDELLKELVHSWVRLKKWLIGRQNIRVWLLQK